MLDSLYLKKLQAVIDAKHLYHLIATSRRTLEEWLPSWSQIDSIDVLEAYIVKQEQSDFYWGEEPYGIWRNDKLIGMVSLHSGQFDEKTVELSYFLGKGEGGKGSMTRACALLISKVFEERKIESIIIQCKAGNIRSQKLAERLGFECLSSDLGLLVFVLHRSNWLKLKHSSLYFLWFRD